MKKLKNVRVLTTAALLVAIATVLGFLKVPLTELIELRFAFLPIAVAGMMFGPAVGCTVGVLADVLGYLVRPTGPFFPGFTIATGVSGLIYAFFFYKKKITLPRIIAASAAETIVVSLVINSINLHILYGTPILAVITAKLLKNAVMFPINTALLAVVLKPVRRMIPSQATGTAGR